MLCSKRKFCFYFLLLLFFARANFQFQCRLSFTESEGRGGGGGAAGGGRGGGGQTLLLCPYSLHVIAVASCISICGHVENPKHRQPHHCLDTEIPHALVVGMGSAAPAATVPYPNKATRISCNCKGQRSANKKLYYTLYINIIILGSQQNCPLWDN